MTSEREVKEPPNSTVDDWFGQQAAHDADVADEVVEETGGDLEAAEKEFDQRADGRENYEKGHPRP